MPYALRKARLKAHVSPIRISAPRTSLRRTFRFVFLLQSLEQSRKLLLRIPHPRKWGVEVNNKDGPKFIQRLVAKPQLRTSLQPESTKSTSVNVKLKEGLMRIVRRSRLSLFVLIMLSLPMASFAQVGIAITIGPPALPVYTQPLCPAAGYIWVPGYWAYDYTYGDYYWVPGTWVLAPEVGYLWTPPYWAWENNAYIFHAGYWGPTVGFYGGIDYGFGYFGHGYEGGRWNHGQFFYNRSVNNINVTNIHNVYNVTVVDRTVNRVSYNGGAGGVDARPTAAEEAAARERHIPPVAAQTQQERAASSNQQLRASVNHGRPPIAATPKPGTFSGHGIVAAKAAGAPYHPPANRGSAEAKAGPAPHPASASAAHSTNESAARPPHNVPQPPMPVHARNLPPPASPTPKAGNTEAERQRQAEQEKLNAQQEQERQQLERSQEEDHQRLAQQKASAAQVQQMEQRHQQQTMQMAQRHAQQQRQLQARQAAPPHNEARPAPQSHGEAKPGTEKH